MENNELDEILNAALSRYSSVEPLEGLEERVLNRVRVTGSSSRFRLWPWICAAALASATAAILTISWMRPVPAPARVILPVARAVPRQDKRKEHARFRKPREFPTPLPVTREERALLALAVSAPEAARTAFFDLRQHAEEPIQVEAIKIEPIQNEELR